MQPKQVAFLAFFLALFPIRDIGAFAQTLPGDAPRYANATSVDLVGYTYNQYLLSYERLIVDHLSLCLSAGGSPEAEFLSPTFRYLYFQAEGRGYPLSPSLSGLYTGFGLSMYFADTLLDFSRWNLSRSDPGSTAVATFAEIGWKFVIPLNRKIGLSIDPNVNIYTIHPLPLSTVQTLESKPFIYKPFAAMGSLGFGLVF